MTSRNIVSAIVLDLVPVAFTVCVPTPPDDAGTVALHLYVLFGLATALHSGRLFGEDNPVSHTTVTVSPPAKPPPLTVTEVDAAPCVGDVVTECAVVIRPIELFPPLVNQRLPSEPEAIEVGPDIFIDG